ncbi:MAG: hypothetical protein ABJA98_30900 [Acidobacteriota bacterium]
MIRRGHVSSLKFVTGWLGAALALSAVCGSALTAQTPTAPPGAQDASDHQSQTATNARVFASDAGLVLNFVKPDKTADFEAIVSRLQQALQKSEKAERKQQAASWKVFRALEPGANGSVLYVFAIDPAVKGADYTVSTILAEAFPTEVQALYKQYAESYASGQNFVNLTLVSALSHVPPDSGRVAQQIEGSIR